LVFESGVLERTSTWNPILSATKDPPGRSLYGLRGGGFFALFFLCLDVVLERSFDALMQSRLDQPLRIGFESGELERSLYL
jgi:hypothetical protein